MPTVTSRKTISLFLILSIKSIQALHLSHDQTPTDNADPNTYNKNLYLNQLTGIQNRFASDLTSIKDKFTRMNLQLSSTNISSSSQVIILQQNLAEERDAIYNIQKYLSLPFALKSCECINFTDAQKNKMKTEIDNITESINALQKNIRVDENGNLYQNFRCPNGDCPSVKFILAEVKKMKEYARIMSDTATAQCCKKVTYVFRDNVAANNQWIYGNLTEEQYRLALFKIVSKFNVTACPAKIPFANIDSNQCYACPTDKPVFNLQTRTCVPGCTAQNKILDNNTHNCVVNTTCDTGFYFNNKTNQCTLDLGTNSNCPQNRPVWNSKTLSCQRCPEAKPFFDLAVSACRACTINEIWNAQTLTCYSKNNFTETGCQPGKTFNIDTLKCQSPDDAKTSSETPGGNTNAGSPNPNGNDGTDGSDGVVGAGVTTFSQCPPETPFWSQSSYACLKCPTSTPLFNKTTNNCQKCPSGTTWNPSGSQCSSSSSICKSTQFWSKALQKCIVLISCTADKAVNQATGLCEDPHAVGFQARCPPATPSWNANLFKCQTCPITTPTWNSITNKCQACSTTQVWDAVLAKCLAVNNCPSGQAFNPTTKQCQPINCNADKPIFNFQSNQCEACPTGTTYSSQTNICQSNNNREGLSGVCGPENPYWNSFKLSCQACPPSQTYNSVSRKCEASAAAAHLRMINKQHHSLANSHENHGVSVHSKVKNSHLLRYAS